MNINSLFGFLALAMLLSCNKDEEINRPVLTSPKVNAIAFDGATFEATVVALNPASWTEFGFIWGTTSEASVTIGQVPAKGTFTQAVIFKWSPNTIYKVRFYVRNSSMVYYSAQTEFKSPPLPPILATSFEPKSGKSGTQITVTGDHFTDHPLNSVYLLIGNTVHCPSLSITNTQIVFVVPDVPLESKAFNVAMVADYVSFPLTGTFTFTGPTISGVTPSSGVPGSVVTILGSGFSPTPSENEVRFEVVGYYFPVTVLTASPTQLTVATQPDLAGFTYNVHVRVENISAVLPNSFTIVGCTITAIVPSSAYPGQTVTLNGTNFSPVVAENLATFNGVNATILTASTTQITLTFPPDITSDQRSIPGPITLYSGYTACVSTSIFTPLSPWHFQTGPPGSRRSGEVAFSIGQYGYMGTGVGSGPELDLKDLWQYDPSSDSWSRKADLPGIGRAVAFSFVINGKGYVGGGYHNTNPITLLSDLWEYDPGLDTWTRKQDFPSLSTGESRFTSAMTIGSKAYVIDGTDVYQYDPSVDQWTKMTNPFPGMPTIYNLTFNFANEGYFGLGLGNGGSSYNNELWRYTPATDQWTRMADYPESKTWLNISFTIGGMGYVCHGPTPIFHRYDPTANSWIRLPDFPESYVEQGKGFEINGQGYGLFEVLSYQSIQMVRFDPNY